MDRIPHIDDLSPDEFLEFLDLYHRGKLEISEKLDGSCRISFGVKDGKLWTESKYGQRKYSSAEYPDLPRYRALKAAHRALESAQPPLVQQLQYAPGAILVAEVLHTAVPNTIEYGPEAIVVHGKSGMSEQKLRAVLKRTTIPGWIFEGKPIVKLHVKIPVHERRTLHIAKRDGTEFKARQMQTKRHFLVHMRQCRPKYGPKYGDIEGLVFRNPKNERMYKLVDRDYFTALNEFNWRTREMIERGIKVQGIWQPGVMQELWNRFADEVARAPVVKTPGLVPFLQRYSTRINMPETVRRPLRADYLLKEYIRRERLFPGTYLKEFERILEYAHTRLMSIQYVWEAVKKRPIVKEFKDQDGTVWRRREMHPLVKQRTDEAFQEARQRIEDLQTELTRLREMLDEDAKFFLLKAMMGHKYYRLIEALSPGPLLSESTAETKIGAVVGRFQPFHAGHAAMVRGMARDFTKVLVFVAGQKASPDNPLDMDTRLEMMRASLPDVWSKLEVYPAANGHLPTLLKQVSESGKSALQPGMPVFVRVGPDRLPTFQQQAQRNEKTPPGSDFKYNGTIEIQPFEEFRDLQETPVRGSRIRQMLSGDDRDGIRRLLDPHVASDDAAFQKIYAKMRRQMLMQHPMVERIVKMVIDEIGNSNMTGPGSNTFGKGWGSSGWSRAVLAKDDADAESSYQLMNRAANRLMPFTHGQPNSNLPGVNNLDWDDEEVDDLGKPTDLGEAIAEAILRALNDPERRVTVEAVDGKKR